MVEMKRPCWTICLIALWLAIPIPLILTHVAVSGLLPGVQDLPANLVDGFDNIFGFAQLETEATLIESESDKAIGKCQCIQPSVGACTSSSCGMNSGTVAGVGAYRNGVAYTSLTLSTVNTAPELANINAAFTRTLNRVEKVTNDPYLGTAAFSNTNNQLHTITKTTGNITAVADCYTNVEAYCTIRTSANSIRTGISSVNAEIDKFKTSDGVKSWEDSAGLLKALHLMPYTVILAMACFMLFWWFSNGICCCCQGGHMSALCSVTFFFAFWATAAIIWGIVVVIGFLVTQYAGDIEVSSFNNKPKLDVFLAHIQTTFPAFWSKVVADVYDNLPAVYHAGWIFSLVIWIQGIYALATCCCCPYRDKEGYSSGVQGQVVGKQGV